MVVLGTDSSISAFFSAFFADEIKQKSYLYPFLLSGHKLKVAKQDSPSFLEGVRVVIVFAHKGRLGSDHLSESVEMKHYLLDELPDTILVLHREQIILCCERLSG